MSTVTSGPNVNIPTGFAVGTPLALEVKVWDYSTSLTFEGTPGPSARSGVFNFTSADPAGAPVTWVMEGLRAFGGITQSPEPSVIALGMMGVAGLLLVRRHE